VKDRRQVEVELVQRGLGELQLSPALEWLIVPKWALGKGWNKKATRLLLLIPSGYPTVGPDNFYTDADLRLENGQMPGNTGQAELPNLGSWLMFSFHMEASDWQPHTEPALGHNLLTYLVAVRQRLSEAN
jgi:hypothetical protein